MLKVQVWVKQLELSVYELGNMHALWTCYINDIHLTMLICLQFHQIILMTALLPETTGFLHLHPLHSIKPHSMPIPLPVWALAKFRLKISTVNH